MPSHIQRGQARTTGDTVEIVDYLKVARRRVWIILVIPLLAAAGVLLQGQVAATQYQATSYVFAPDVLGGNQFSGPAGVVQWVNEFSATALSPRVTESVARTTGVPASAIANGVEVAQVEHSAQLLLSFSWPDKDLARAVVQQVAMATPRALFTPQVTQAERALRQSQDSLESVNQKFFNAATSWEGTRPDVVYAGRLRELINLQGTRARISAKDQAALAATDAKIAQLKAELVVLGQDVLELQGLRAERQAATNVLARAQEDLQIAKATFAGASGAATRARVTPGPASPTLVKGLLSAVVAGLIIAFCLVAALELLRTRRVREPVPASRRPAERTAFSRVADMAAGSRDG